MSPQRYHPITVALHWIVAILMLMMLGVGTFVLEPMDNADPDKLSMLHAPSDRAGDPRADGAAHRAAPVPARA